LTNWVTLSFSRRTHESLLVSFQSALPKGKLEASLHKGGLQFELEYVLYDVPNLVGIDYHVFIAGTYLVGGQIQFNSLRLPSCN
jgi:hypothetical protein